jgi:transposase-like protein
MIKCPKCKSKNIEILHIYEDTDPLPHNHCRCKECNVQFNVWMCSEKEIKSIWKENWQKYW